MKMEPIPPMPNPAAHLMVGLIFFLFFFWLLFTLLPKEWEDAFYAALGLAGIIFLSVIVGIFLHLSVTVIQGLLLTAVLIFICTLIMIKISHYDRRANYYRGYFQYSKRMLKMQKLLPKIIIFLVIVWIAIAVLGTLKVM